MVINVVDQETGKNVAIDLIENGDILPVCVQNFPELPPIEIPPIEFPSEKTITRWIEDSYGNDALSVHLAAGEKFHLQKIYIVAKKKVELVLGYLYMGYFIKIFPAIEINKETLWLDIPITFNKTFILKIFSSNYYTVGVIGNVQV